MAKGTELIKLLQSLRGLTVTKEICLKIFEGVRSERSLVNLDVSELRISVADDAFQSSCSRPTRF